MEWVWPLQEQINFHHMAGDRNKTMVCAFKVTKRYERYKELQKKIDEKLEYEENDDEGKAETIITAYI
jgi:hypothetical protein